MKAAIKEALSNQQQKRIVALPGILTTIMIDYLAEDIKSQILTQKKTILKRFKPEDNHKNSKGTDSLDDISEELNAKPIESENILNSLKEHIEETKNNLKGCNPIRDKIRSKVAGLTIALPTISCAIPKDCQSDRSRSGHQISAYLVGNDLLLQNEPQNIASVPCSANRNFWDRSFIQGIYSPVPILLSPKFAKDECKSSCFSAFKPPEHPFGPQAYNLSLIHI
eukprot:TRINITY_DN2461_c0_g1_i1.p2 TRINITY_DN2461_c0_g1~~TRINITY_DN2461_c0_g1_i1.p2  ORF type:complete len:224 (-),score=24.47 TRINITY_DN2461_c0_g1_i1:58-729(-)